MATIIVDSVPVVTNSKKLGDQWTLEINQQHLKSSFGSGVVRELAAYIEDDQIKQDWNSGIYSFVIDQKDNKIRAVRQWLKKSCKEFSVTKLESKRWKISFGSNKNEALLFKMFWVK